MVCLVPTCLPAFAAFRGKSDWVCMLAIGLLRTRQAPFKVIREEIKKLNHVLRLLEGGKMKVRQAKMRRLLPIWQLREHRCKEFLASHVAF